MRKQLVILGAGGFAREVLDVIDACNRVEQTYEMLGYIVEAVYGTPGTLVNDMPILGDFDWLESRVGQCHAVCAVGDPVLKLRLVHKAQALGVPFESIVHPQAITTRWLRMGAGVIITAGCILTNQITLGDHVHVNLDCTIGHDVVMKDFVTLAPGVHVSGNVTLATGCYVGTGANIIEKIHIGEWSIIGAGSTIVQDVPPNTTVVGVPGKVIRVRNAGWHQH